MKLVGIARPGSSSTRTIWIVRLSPLPCAEGFGDDEPGRRIEIVCMCR